MRPPVRESYTLAPGVRLTTIRYPDIPQEVRIVRIRQGAGSVVDLFTPTPSYPGYRRPSGMGILGGALAIVNGDFAAPDGRPKHLSIVDGEIWTSGIQQSSVFALSGDGSRAYAGRPDLVLTGSHQGATFSIARMNAGDPTGPRDRCVLPAWRASREAIGFFLASPLRSPVLRRAPDPDR